MQILFLGFDWKSFLLGEEEWEFLLETALRSAVMFIVILFSLRLLGKRGIKQLSVFELGVIIGLGSAAGDPMFYKNVGLLPGIIVFSIVLGLYRLVTYLINHNDKFEQFLEGQPTCLVKEGRFNISNFKKEPIARDELFSQFRLNSVSHLGQIQQSFIETNGEVSIFYYPDDEVIFGLPIIPGECNTIKAIPVEDIYACAWCGNTQKLKPAASYHCNACQHNLCVKASNSKRTQ
jgi:uncharacterized membrane protein YcaP (DUF421 family)